MAKFNEKAFAAFILGILVGLALAGLMVLFAPYITAV